MARPQLRVIRGGAGAPAEETDDEALVRAIRDGAPRAEEELYRRHARAVLLRIQRLVSSRQDAEDALQDTFITALREIGTLREPKALSGWLLKIAVHQAHRRIRRERLLRTLGFGRGGDDEWLAAQARGDLSSEARAELVLLGRSLRGLSATDRIAWTLRWVEDLSLEEVADACGCSLATAKRRIAAAEAVVGRHFAKEGSS